MIARLIIVIAPLAFGFWKGGWTGLLAMLIITSALLALYGSPPVVRQEQPVIDICEDDTSARKGTRIDPTRPTVEDWGGITTTYRERRK